MSDEHLTYTKYAPSFSTGYPDFKNEYTFLFNLQMK